jgi:folate-binding protein YgfZ
MNRSDRYRALKQQAVIGAVAPGSTIAVRGADRASYLQGLLTNDIRALTQGAGCYAAWLTPQGRMLTDLHVFVLEDVILRDVPAELAPAPLQRLDRSLFSEDVQLSDGSQMLMPVWVHDPLAAAAVERAVPAPAGLESWVEYQNMRLELGGSPLVLVRVSQLGVPGFGLYAAPAHAEGLRAALQAAGAMPADSSVLEAARIEAGYPLFGVDMTEDTIPLEAGIEDRAISFTKGCYVGQEVIIRVLHRGHGRVARKLVGLRLEGGVPPQGAKIRAGDRDIGWISSAADSPRLGSIALGYVQRDFVSPGTRVEVELPSAPIPAVVSGLPISPDAR